MDAAPRPNASPRGRLAAILVADVQGFCNLIRSDINGTVARIQGMRDTVEPILTEHGGRLVKSTGDGFIAEFTSASEAVMAARAIQAALGGAAGPALALRIGVSLGEVIVDADGEIFGDAVNLAARIEPFAGAGGIVATQAVCDQLAGRPDLTFEDMGPHRLKGFEQPMSLFRLADGSAVRALPQADAAPRLSALAVLPFRAISSDPSAALLADAVTEDLTTCLARTPGLTVIARFSAAAYGGAGHDPVRAASALGVRYLVEGAIRGLGDRVHVNARLVDVRAGATQAWSGAFEFAVPEHGGVEPEIARRIGARIGVEAMLAEIRGAQEAGPVDRDPWHRVRSAYATLLQQGWSAGTLQGAADHCRAALDLDPALSLPRAILALSLALGRRFGVEADQAGAPDAACEARAAVMAGPRDAETLSFAGFALTELGHDDEGAAILRRAADLDPGNAQAFVALGAHLFARGEWEAGQACLRRGLDMSPQDPRLAVWRSLLASRLLMAERDDEALVEAHAAIEADPGFAPAWLVLAAAWRGLDDDAAAGAALAQALRLQPTMTPDQAEIWGGRQAADLLGRR
ncbi:adenylate/guanylate cyclase domain-containing protein [Salinarimonas soli]|nr:adenylate/guanylate cyclase domain-containing protein [Salinarimonas soli]